MKKFVLGLITACFGLAMFTFAACDGTGAGGLSEEEQFSRARESFDNYTVEVNIKYSDGDAYNSVLLCDGTKGKLTVKGDSAEGDWVRYYSEDYGKVFLYDEEDGDWTELSYDTTIEEATADYNGYVMIFAGLFYDDFEKEGDYFVAKADALASYNEEYGIAISSAKLKMSGGRFTTATAIVDVGIRMELTYLFKNYGTTRVTLPQ